MVARFIDVEILLKSGGAALAVGALKEGYDRYMVRRVHNEERELRLQTEQQLADERKRADETIRMVTELVNEFREERRQNASTRQAMLDAVLRLVERNGSNSRNGD